MNFKLILLPQVQIYEILRNETFSEEVRQMKLIAFTFHYAAEEAKKICSIDRNSLMIRCHTVLPIMASKNQR